MNIVNDLKGGTLIDRMFKAGAHFAYSKSRRHPSAKPYIFGVKNRVEIFDLEKTEELLKNARQFVMSLGKEGKTLLFVGGKAEARDAVRSGAKSVEMPYVAGRWIGGTITNFGQIKSRINKLADLLAQREKGELAKYTKKERLLIDREIDRLNVYFSGLSSLKDLPKALFVIDSGREKIAVEEAHKAGIPVVALAGSDCDLKQVEYPIVGNDSSVASISLFLNEITSAYQEGKKSQKVEV